MDTWTFAILKMFTVEHLQNWTIGRVHHGIRLAVSSPTPPPFGPLDRRPLGRWAFGALEHRTVVSLDVWRVTKNNGANNNICVVVNIDHNCKNEITLTDNTDIHGTMGSVKDSAYGVWVDWSPTRIYAWIYRYTRIICLKASINGYRRVGVLKQAKRTPMPMIKNALASFRLFAQKHDKFPVSMAVTLAMMTKLQRMREFGLSREEEGKQE